MNALRILLKLVCVLHIVLFIAAIHVIITDNRSEYTGFTRLTTAFQQQIAAMQAHSTTVLSQPNFVLSETHGPQAVPITEPARSPHFTYKKRKWAGMCPEVKYTIHVNTAQAGGEDGSVEDFRRALIAAADTWNAVSNAGLVLTYDGETDATDIGFNGSNEIMFVAQGLDAPAALARFWFTGDKTIIEADIWINDDYNWDATGAPAPNEIDLQSVALHELGHWLALGHDENKEAIMHATIPMGELRRELHQNDRDGIGFIYPASADGSCPTTPPGLALQQLLPFSLLNPPSTTPSSAPDLYSAQKTTTSPFDSTFLSRINMPKWAYTMAE